MLFDHSQLALRAVPDRWLALPDLPRPLWDVLQVPVGTAFLMVGSDGGVTALYPGPAGATESTLDLSGWEQLRSAVPALSVLAPDVEALLVHDADGRVEAFVVPVDACYQLVGTLRQVWHGFDGGADVRARLEEFFAGVRYRARPG
jgi:hypothetical protein